MIFSFQETDDDEETEEEDDDDDEEEEEEEEGEVVVVEGEGGYFEDDGFIDDEMFGDAWVEERQSGDGEVSSRDQVVKLARVAKLVHIYLTRGIES